MKIIERIKIKNFGRFKEFSIGFDQNLNVLIGDNEAGKSTILNAIDIVLSGSRSKVENYGLDHLFNSEVIEDFLSSNKKYENLPILYAELYLNDQSNKDLDGKWNSDGIPAHGIQLICEPREDLSKEIKDILLQDDDNFPFEYYSIIFKTFSGESYTGYRKFMQHILLDNTQINNEYATKSYIKTLYHNSIKDAEKNKHHNEYRKHKENFRTTILKDLNERIEDYSFAIRTNSKANLETDLTIKEGNIEIQNKGKGRQCFIKTDFALKKNEKELDIILLEEPENHLSHINMKKLIRRINESENKQLFIATHSNLISTRLDLRKAIMLNSNSPRPTLLEELPADTSKFFMKAPDNNILEYILSKKVLLVEGDAEFILMEAFYEKLTNEKIEDSDIHIISVGGTSFKRYLDIAKLLNIKTAVIRDNDGNYQVNCIDRYDEYVQENIKVFSSENNDISTFEISVYETNKDVCDNLFLAGRKTLSVQDYMLKNKADVAFELLDKKADTINVPDYIKNAIEWIKA
ncbi:ATP-dependent nuclease [Aequorivita sinensis]|uniref:ATP-dependent nuclease n=1 Tax=Aequorivita sinensis TaxID=1382458 RepID=UPI002301F2AB|nr:TOPRIM nucleotidyl transferase/hydrolase domain-containing protein [Aequorivita sinensis]